MQTLFYDCFFFNVDISENYRKLRTEIYTQSYS